MCALHTYTQLSPDPYVCGCYSLSTLPKDLPSSMCIFCHLHTHSHRSSQPPQPPGDWSGPYMMDKQTYVCITVCVAHVHCNCTFVCAVTCGVAEVGKTVTLMYTVPDPADRITWEFIPQQNEEWVLSITFFVMLWYFSILSFTFQWVIILTFTVR